MRAALVLFIAAAGCTSKRTEPVETGPRLQALRVSTPPTLDGAMEERPWVETPSSGAFMGLDGGMTSPHTELRALFTNDALVLGVYAADQDVISSDGVHLRVAGRELFIDVRGRLTGAPEGVQGAVELDGSLDEAGDEDDEEWTAEIALPWRALGFDPPPDEVPVSVWRFDTPKGASPREVSWSGVLRQRI